MGISVQQQQNPQSKQPGQQKTAFKTPKYLCLQCALLQEHSQHGALQGALLQEHAYLGSFVLLLSCRPQASF